ncbi:MAG: S41 family peptidase [Planctomycetia bacterium]|nr:S41 family peptidase [Planctomycetia bacterium]
MRHFFNIYFVFFVVIIFIGGILQKAYGEDVLNVKGTDTSASAKNKEEDYFQDYRMLIDTIDQVDRNYVNQVSRQELIEAALQGVMKKLDPYSDYIRAPEMEKFRASVDSKFGGIGVQLQSEGGNLIVVAPLPGTPAYEKGVHSGDMILSINGHSADKISVDEAVGMMKGEIGTPVILKLRRQGNPEPFEVEIVREIIHLETVFGFDRREDDSWDYWLDKENGIAYILISTFSHGTAKELKRVLELLKNTEDTCLKGLVLDLRFNPGGILPVAIDVCDMFVREGRIVSIKGRNVEEQVWDAKPENTVCDVPMVVLINHYSASASEIVSACLQDHGRAVLVGERTWGKGSVQNVMEMESGYGALKLTTAGYFRPNGKNIHREEGVGESEEWGVTPEEENVVPMTVVQHYRLSEDQRRRQGLRTHGGEMNVRKENIFEDPQLCRALEVLQKKLGGTRKNAQSVLRDRLRKRLELSDARHVPLKEGVSSSTTASSVTERLSAVNGVRRVAKESENGQGTGAVSYGRNSAPSRFFRRR